jgi:hypothetical protein
VTNASEVEKLAAMGAPERVRIAGHPLKFKPLRRKSGHSGTGGDPADDIGLPVKGDPAARGIHLTCLDLVSRPASLVRLIAGRLARRHVGPCRQKAACPIGRRTSWRAS